MRLVMVEWIDTMGSATWSHLRNYETVTPATARTVGWVVNDFPDYIEVAQSLMAEEDPAQAQVNNTMSIPRDAIRSITDIAATKLGVDN